MSIDEDLIAFIGGNCEVGSNIFDHLLNLTQDGKSGEKTGH